MRAKRWTLWALVGVSIVAVALPRRAGAQTRRKLPLPEPPPPLPPEPEPKPPPGGGFVPLEDVFMPLAGLVYLERRKLYQAHGLPDHVDALYRHPNVYGTRRATQGDRTTLTWEWRGPTGDHRFYPPASYAMIRAMREEP